MIGSTWINYPSGRFLCFDIENTKEFTFLCYYSSCMHRWHKTELWLFEKLLEEAHLFFVGKRVILKFGYSLRAPTKSWLSSSRGGLDGFQSTGFLWIFQHVSLVCPHFILAITQRSSFPHSIITPWGISPSGHKRQALKYGNGALIIHCDDPPL